MITKVFIWWKNGQIFKEIRPPFLANLHIFSVFALFQSLNNNISLIYSVIRSSKGHSIELFVEQPSFKKFRFLGAETTILIYQDRERV